MAKDVKHSFEDLDNVLRYNAATGEFSWKIAVSSRAKAGGRAGVWQRMQNGRDYLGVTYQGVKLSGARLAWLLHYGVWPDRSVFYVDGDSTNIRISNLKLADHKADRITGDDGKVRYLMSTEAARHYGLRRNYGLSYTEYAKMFAEQLGVCDICGKEETAIVPGRKTDKTATTARDLSVDHDHETGAIRGLLCNACNHILGEAKDSATVLRSAADYLDKHSGATPNVVKFSEEKA